MLIQRLPVGVALSMVLLTGACGDKDRDDDFTQTDSSVIATPGDGGTTPSDGKDAGLDGGGAVGLDGGSLPDGATGPTPVADGSGPAPVTDGSAPAPATDGSVPAPVADGGVPAPVADGSVPAPVADGSVPAPVADGSVPASDAAVDIDGSVVTEDSGAPVPVVDAAAPDAGIVVDAGPCPINHPSYGCGHEVSTGWVVFDTGLEIDRVNHLAWTPAVEVPDDDALRDICTPLALGGLTGYSLPQMTQVRTLAAGCPETVPGGSCQVDEDMVSVAEAGDCTCTGGVGPKDGKFCRPEVPTCETLWAWTHTFETGWYEHWFYDVTTGSIVAEEVGVGIAIPAKGRCVRELTDAELP